MPTVHDCNLVLRSGKKRFLDIYNRMAISKIVVSPTEKTWYRYYCEAVMMLRHFQRPAAVEGMTVSVTSAFMNEGFETWGKCCK